MSKRNPAESLFDLATIPQFVIAPVAIVGRLAQMYNTSDSNFFSESSDWDDWAFWSTIAVAASTALIAARLRK